MNWLNPILIFVAAMVAVFCEAFFSAPRHWLGAQIDVLPVLMVYAALNTDGMVVAAFAIFGGMCFDSLSENPFGLTILPLFAVGYPICLGRELILREFPFAQSILGGAACAGAPAISLLLLLSAGRQPILGWGTIWQWIVMTVGGAALAPVIFRFFDWCNHTFGYQPRTEVSFRADREIKRDRRIKPE